MDSISLTLREKMGNCVLFRKHGYLDSTYITARRAFRNSKKCVYLYKTWQDVNKQTP